MSWGPGVRAAFALVGAVVVAVGLTSVPSTTAAWTDDVVLAPAAATGTWAAPPVTNPGGVVTAGPSTTLTGVSWSIPNDPAGTVCVDISVTGTSTTPTPWSVSIDLGGPPYFGTSWWQLYYGTATQVSFAAGSTSTSTRVTGVGLLPVWNSEWSNRLLTSSRSLTFRPDFGLSLSASRFG